jgi:branched-chain amino acid transport system permease protein
MPLAYTFSEYVAQVVAGLGSGAVLFLVASGLTLIFGALRVINFAHGALYLLGAYLTISLSELISFGNATFWIIAILAALAVAGSSVILEVGFFRPIYKRPLLTQLLVTFSFVLIMAGIFRNFWNPTVTSTPTPAFLGGGVQILDNKIPTYQFFWMGLAVAVGIALWALLYKTGLGRMIRAAVSDPELLNLSGVNVRRLVTGVFVIAAVVAGLAGSVTTFQGSIEPGAGIDAIIRAFVIVVIGGLGSLSGAFIACMVVGVAEALGGFWVPQASLAIVFAVLVVVLAIRPLGLRGATE